MNYDEEFDRIIRQKAEEQEYAFEESHWNKARKLIDEDRAATRKAAFKNLYLPGGMLLLMAGLSFWMISAFSGNEAVSEQNEILAMYTPETGGKIQPVALRARLNHTEPSGTRDTELQRSVSPEKDQAEQKPTNITLPPTTVATGKSAQYTKPSATTQQTEASGPQNGPEVSPAETALSAGVADSNEGEANGFSAEIVLAENTSDAPETDILLQPVNAYLDFTGGTDAEVMQSAFVYLKRYDEDYFKAHQRRTHFLDVEAGAFYGLGWQTVTGWDGKGLNWFAGLNYGRYTGDNTSVSAGLQYYQIGHIANPFFNQVKTSYAFGSVESGSTITSHKLHYLALPLRFNYAISAGSRLSAGINTGFLFRSNNSVQAYTMLDNVRTNTDLSHDNYVYNDQRRLNLSLTAGYRVNLHRRLVANAEFIYGLTDIFVNNRMVKNPEKTTGFRLSLQYTIFDK